jgi:hypothetical protein
MGVKANRFVYWTPRILSIILVLFLTIFSADVFGENLGFWQTVLALLMHNIPSLLLAAIIWVSWKYEIVGGVAFIIAGIAHMVLSVVRVDVEPWYISAAFSLIIDGSKRKKVCNRSAEGRQRQPYDSILS